MTKELTHPILSKPILSLGLSAEFEAMAKTNGYNTLLDVLKDPLYKFPMKHLSGYRMLKELIGILKVHGLDELIDD